MKIFITGATGLVGAAVCREAIRNGHEILALRRPTSVSPFSITEEKHITWTLDDDSLKEIVSDYKPDVLAHFAWGGVNAERRNDECAQDANFVFSKRLFELYPYKQIISMGSQAEYGYYESRVSEDDSLNPQNSYGETKIKTCLWLQEYCQEKGIEWQWLRIFTIFGEGLRVGVIPFAIKKCLSGEQTLETTKGEQVYSFLYAPDFAKALMNVFGAKGKSGIYNVSQPRNEHTIKDVLLRIKKLTHSDIDILFGAIPYRDRQVMLMSGKVDKFEKAFGVYPNTDFDQALLSEIESMR